MALYPCGNLEEAKRAAQDWREDENYRSLHDELHKTSNWASEEGDDADREKAGVAGWVSLCSGLLRDDLRDPHEMEIVRSKCMRVLGNLSRSCPRSRALRQAFEDAKVSDLVLTMLQGSTVPVFYIARVAFFCNVQCRFDESAVAEVMSSRKITESV
jgi:hypothetical protein